MDWRDLKKAVCGAEVWEDREVIWMVELTGVFIACVRQRTAKKRGLISGCGKGKLYSVGRKKGSGARGEK